ncbi:MAG: C40 family peptidase [Eubacterium sp.]|nr:C40 family peptidase [Eubacterium sp.]
MADIKEVAKQTIKTVDRAAIATEKIKDVGIKTKENVKKVTETQENNPNEYATNKSQASTEAAVGTAIYVANKVGRKSYEKTKQDVKYYRDRLRYGEPVSQKRTLQFEAEEIKEAGERTAKTIDNIKTVNSTTQTNSMNNAIKTHTGSLRSKKTIKTVEGNKKVIRSANDGRVLAQETMRQSAKAAKKSEAITRESAKEAAKLAKKAAAFLKKIAKLTIEAVKSLVSAIIAGGWTAVIVIIVICMIGAVAYSVYGIFFSNEDSGTGITIQSAVIELNEEFWAETEKEKAKYTYDTLDMSGYQADWKEVLAIYSVKVNTDPDNPLEVATIDESKKNMLRDIFWDMNSITSRTETEESTTIVETTDEEGNVVQEEQPVTKVTLYLTINGKSADEMAELYNFSDNQKEYLAELLSPKNDKMWNSLIYGFGIGKNIDISSLDFSNESATEEQKKVVIVATNSAEYGIPASKGYCQAWVADVYQVSVGNRGHAASAVAAGRMWSVSTDWSQIQVGAAVYGYSSSQYGHVGIYIGNGMVAHNIGGVKIETLEHWVQYYKGVCWGWENGKNLSGSPKYNCVGGLI